MVHERSGMVFLLELQTGRTSHAIAMKGALSYLTPPERGSYRPKYIENCAIYRTELIDGVYTEPVQIR